MSSPRVATTTTVIVRLYLAACADVLHLAGDALGCLSRWGR